jgi:hypothetical protein
LRSPFKSNFRHANGDDKKRKSQCSRRCGLSDAAGTAKQFVSPPLCLSVPLRQSYRHSEFIFARKHESSLDVYAMSRNVGDDGATPLKHGRSTVSEFENGKGSKIFSTPVPVLFSVLFKVSTGKIAWKNLPADSKNSTWVLRL